MSAVTGAFFIPMGSGLCRLDSCCLEQKIGLLLEQFYTDNICEMVF